MIEEPPVLNLEDKAREELYWRREQARWDFSEWLVAQHEAEIAAEWARMTPEEREAAVDVAASYMEPW